MASKLSSLNDRDAATWRKVMFAASIAGAIFLLQSIVSASLGGIHITAVTLPLAVFFIAIAFMIKLMLNARRRQLDDPLNTNTD